MHPSSQHTLPDIAVLDGGTGTYLTENGHPELGTDPLWGSGLLYRDIDAIKAVHLSFLAAGSDIIESVTYQASIEGFTTHLNLSEGEAIDLIKKGVHVALQVRNDFWQDNPDIHKDRTYPLVAASLGPYGACQADGSEYTGNYVDNLTIEELMSWHRPRIRAVIDAGADLLAIDTVPAQKEAEALVRLLSSEFPDALAWLSFSCSDEEHTCHGEDIVDAVKSVAGCQQIFGIGLNCSPPEYISTLIKRIKPHVNGKKLVVYPNSGEKWTSEKSWQGRESVRPLDDYAKEWFEIGVHWIGGCCRIRPEDITQLRLLMDQLKQTHIK